MSNINSPYQKSGILSSALTPTIISGDYMPGIMSFDDQTFEQQLNLPIGSYELDFQNFLATSCSQPQTIPSTSLFNLSSLSHLTPVSEATSDFYDCATPMSAQTPFDFHATSGLQPALTSIDTSIEIAPPSRPRSSPGAIGPNPPNPWANISPENAHDGLGIHIGSLKSTPAPSPRRQHQSSISSVSDMISPPRPKQWTPIAPNPVGIVQMRAGHKRAYSEDDFENSPLSKRKRSGPPSPSQNPNFDVDPENQMLLQLRDKEHLSWKDIQARFETELGKSYRIATLQMRLTRLRERMRTWTDVDVQALRMAHEYSLTHKFEIIASKMADFGATEKWSNRQCQKKSQELGLFSENTFTHHIFNQTPTFVQSYSSSPTEDPQVFHPTSA